jgi:chitinase
MTPKFYHRLQADDQANVYGGARTNVSTHEAIKWYLSQGATASKINMGETQKWPPIHRPVSSNSLLLLHIGIPLYGRSFGNTAGLGQPSDRVNTKLRFQRPLHRGRPG